VSSPSAGVAAPEGALRSGWRRLTYRRVDLGPLLDTFLVSAIVCMLLIRLILHLTGYPQLGNSSLHIAHMLWGGLGMALAIIVLLAFPTRIAAQTAAFIGGLGFGAFIDELGKFITQDNDYFFAPTIGIIYVIFIVMYLGFRQLEGSIKPSPTVNLINAIELTKEAALRSMDIQERTRALELLRLCDPDDPLVHGLTDGLRSYAVTVAKPGPIARLKTLMVRSYKRLIAWRWFAYTFLGVSVALSLGSLVYNLTQLPAVPLDEMGFEDWGQAVSSIVSQLLVLAGVLVFRRSRLRAYRLIDGGILVSIFFTQFFDFLQNELAAIGGLFLALLAHGVVRYLIDQETAVLAEQASTGAATPPQTASPAA
jgi:hypothetical protein